MSNCNSDPCLAGIEEKLDQNKINWLNVEVPIITCELQNGEYKPKRETKKVKVLSTSSGSETLKVQYNFQEIAKTNEELCLLKNLEPTLAVPEWWQARVFQRPQLVIQYAEETNGKLGRSRWSVSLPHYNKQKTFKPDFPKYKKGNTEGVLVLTDNSKIIINASSKSEVIRVINSLKNFVDAKFLKGIQPPRIGERNKVYKSANVVPVRCSYFPKGQQDVAPEWSIKLWEKKK
ncbi:hypothetical protein IQ247_23980 [Plectonema cf. radiosum LEGE 06105]|uniref:Uncharacterized protein n=1 Tax=Plectonema cf. radiosum LEGE 06105 TaxID=945769 RepID=A0A8J7F5R6_9CYAN|nr:hypothetical protein [Plectonema radiosum]MBE9215687.1 hypothetical protein [Plectonema cf. radiosum LEGE 06105]